MGWGEEHGTPALGGNERPPGCSYCRASWHPGICPRVRAIEYHPNGNVKRVEFVGDTPIPRPAFPSDQTGHVVKPASTFTPDLQGRDLGPFYPQITAVGP